MEEYISREAFKEKYLCCGYIEDMTEEEFDSFPAADVRPVVHGAWVPHFEDYRGMLESNKCSVCGYEYYGTLYNFCPNCGAMMDGGSNG